MLTYSSVRTTGIKPGHKNNNYINYKLSIDEGYFWRSKFK